MNYNSVRRQLPRPRLSWGANSAIFGLLLSIPVTPAPDPMAPPPCRTLGPACRALRLTVRVSALEGTEDHDATWFAGHTERIDFGRTFEKDDELWCEVRVHVPCRHLQDQAGSSRVHCHAHGYEGTVQRPKRPPQPRRLGNDTFRLFEQRQLVDRHIPPPTPHRRALPVAPDANPCATADCRTSDHTRGGACCRDIQVDIRCDADDTFLEALLRNRKAPYLCKVERAGDDGLVNAEIISACAFLQEDRRHCDLHGRQRADGRPAKPEMCSHWPEKRTGLHPGCAFRSRRVPL